MKKTIFVINVWAMELETKVFIIAKQTPIIFP